MDNPLLGIGVGIGLSAACGFRVFVPLLGISIAHLTGHLELSSGFEWIGSPLACLGFGTATLMEIAAYYIPWVDNAMDAISSPAAVGAGIIVTASMVGDIDPFIKWSLAIVAGGGVAGMIQQGTVLARGTSSATTGGFGNPVISTMELIGAVLLTLFAIVLPILTAFIACYLLVKVFRKLFFKKKIQSRRY